MGVIGSYAKPPDRVRAFVDRVPLQELCRGQLLAASRTGYAKVIRGLGARGAEEIGLSCTEIGLPIGDAPFPVPLFDTGAIRVRAAADAAVA